MDANDVLKHLQLQFPGQFVLFAPDLAQVLGKSEKALSHLIARQQLPFQVKSLGGKKCVDIFQIADWLATNDCASEYEAPLSDARQKATGARSRRGSSGTRSGIGAKLMEMRLGAARALVRNLTASRTDDQEFIVVLADSLALFQRLPATTYTIYAVWWDSINGSLISSETHCHCGCADEVRVVLDRLKLQLSIAVAARIVVSQGRKELHCTQLRDTGDWLVLRDEIID